MSKALEEAIKAFKTVPLSYNTVPVAIEHFLTHHLEHPEAVARAVRMAAPERVVTAQELEDKGDGIKVVHEVIQYQTSAKMQAKAALQCLIEDLRPDGV